MFGRKPWRRPAKRGTCHRSANNSSSFSTSRSPTSEPYLRPAADRRSTVMNAIRPRWAPWSYLLYAGGFVLLAAAGRLLHWFSDHYGAFKVPVLSFLVFAGFAFVARSLRRGGDHPIAAGLFAFTSVILFGAFVGALYDWFGWLDLGDAAFAGFNLARLTIVLLVLWASLVALRLFH